MDVFSRREFLNRAAILSAAAASGTTALAQTQPLTASRARAANDRLRVAVVGVNGRGMSHVAGFTNRNINTEITVVCDCDEAVIGNAMKRVESAQGKAPKYEKDIRRVIENKDIDVVAIATPNHWHALMAVWAMQNGKDVYCEKPASHNVKEGAIMLATARKFNRICQVGTQSRSNQGMRDAIAYVQSGKLGKVDLAIGLCYKPRGSIGKVKEPTQPPASIDYDLWCGPAPKLPVMRAKLHYDWHWIYAYGNGDLGNQGVHEMDKARWGLNKGTMPNSVVSAGGRFGYVDDGETANTQLCLFDYGDSHLIFEVRGLKTDKYKGAGVGNIFVGSEGYVVCPDYGTGIVYDKSGKEIQKFSDGNDQHHFDNFVKAVRSRKVEDLNCDVSEGHFSAALCHLANISYRLGAETTFDKDIAGLSDSKEAGEFLSRMKDHLKANGVDLSKAVGRAGPKLGIDPKTQTFTGNNSQANAMLFREYRKGFELKETV
ncbi:MAG TPA: Gfo/Idh/MocA family oxidoreductase [Gemmataceae bacterium]|nr:Gfo/Idh/MocA family oxidoreductase [Gemmataceae bacterium]